jgi:hypothetical protein
MKNDKHVEGKMAIFGGKFFGLGPKKLPPKKPPFKKKIVIIWGYLNIKFFGC